jgi:hypothetical protein
MGWNFFLEEPSDISTCQEIQAAALFTYGQGRDGAPSIRQACAPKVTCLSQSCVRAKLGIRDRNQKFQGGLLANLDTVRISK